VPAYSAKKLRIVQAVPGVGWPAKGSSSRVVLPAFCCGIATDDEGGLGEVGLVGDPLHFRTQFARVFKDGQLVSLKGLVREGIA